MATGIENTKRVFKSANSSLKLILLTGLGKSVHTYFLRSIRETKEEAMNPKAVPSTAPAA